MTRSTLLLHLDDTPACTQRIEVTFKIAHRFHSHVTGLAASGSVPLAAVASPGGMGIDVLGPALVELEMSAQKRASAFRERCAGAGLASFDALVTEDDDTRALLRHARACDLVVMGQADSSQPGSGAARRAVEDVVLQCPRPVLVVPFAGHFHAVGEKVLVAWDGGRECARAVGDALPLLRRARHVRLVACETPLDVGSESTRVDLDAMRQWLHRHGVEVSAEVAWTEIDVGNALLSRAADHACDLIVMGAYGHARWAERVLGGVTRTMLSSMTVPVLMSR
jgi:nucleotide-binding universal stress UspA family protein